MPDLLTFQNASGIPPAIVVSQILAESWTSHGASTLATKYNNLFGLMGDGSWMKAGNPIAWMRTNEYYKGKTPPAYWTYSGKIMDYAGNVLSTAGDIMQATDNRNGSWTLAVVRPFRYYATVAECLANWYSVLQHSNYAGALAAARNNDLQGFAQGMVSGGWATDPQYAQNIMDNDGSALV